MNKRIAKKVQKARKAGAVYPKRLVAASCKRLGLAKTPYNMKATETGRSKSFNYRTGTAPTTKGAIMEEFKAQEENVPVFAATSMQYESMALGELRALAKSKGLSGYSALKKADLVALLEGGA